MLLGRNLLLSLSLSFLRAVSNHCPAHLPWSSEMIGWLKQAPSQPLSSLAPAPYSDLRAMTSFYAAADYTNSSLPGLPTTTTTTTTILPIAYYTSMLLSLIRARSAPLKP